MFDNRQGLPGINDAMVMPFCETTKTKRTKVYWDEPPPYLYIYTADGVLSIRSLQLAGKKRMGVGDFLRGSRLGEGYKVQ